jgi:uncharacterized membrane protein YphA (DoxX/SURF4 family)
VEAMQRTVAMVPRFRLSSVGLACALLALIFLTAGLAKIQRFDEFESTLVASRLVPLYQARLAATALIVLELVLAASLLHPRTRTTALQTAALLICVFIGYSAWRWMQNIPVPCHCFGVLFTMTPWQAILFNLALLGLTIWPLVRNGAGDHYIATVAPRVSSTANAHSEVASGPPKEFYVTREELFP